MHYHRYGIPPELVERVKVKLKNPVLKEQVKQILRDVTKYDLQDRLKVRQLLGQISRVLNERLTEHQKDAIVQFVLDQKIDPKHKLHLLRLWSMFR